ncbi:MAG: GtrA family protein [Patescibacteria group bacterium]
MERGRMLWQTTVLPFLRFVLISLAGSVVSVPLYAYFRTDTTLGIFASSRISNLVAQAIDFFPHKLFSFKEQRLEKKVVWTEGILYTVVAAFLLYVEPWMLYSAERWLDLNHLQAWFAVHPITGLTRFILYRLIFKKFNGH